jgi:hypothetical protein
VHLGGAISFVAYAAYLGVEDASVPSFRLCTLSGLDGPPASQYQSHDSSLAGHTVTLMVVSPLMMLRDCLRGHHNAIEGQCRLSRVSPNGRRDHNECPMFPT